MHPLQKSCSWFKAHRTLMVTLIWTYGITIGISQLYISETSSFVHNGQVYTSCGERWPPESMAGQLYTIFIFTFTFALPMAILSVVYTAMGYRLIKYRMPGQVAQTSSWTKAAGHGQQQPGQQHHHLRHYSSSLFHRSLSSNTGNNVNGDGETDLSNGNGGGGYSKCTRFFKNRSFRCRNYFGGASSNTDSTNGSPVLVALEHNNDKSGGKVAAKGGASPPDIMENGTLLVTLDSHQRKGTGMATTTTANGNVANHHHHSGNIEVANNNNSNGCKFSSGQSNC